jgi:hypothetical protein
VLREDNGVTYSVTGVQQPPPLPRRRRRRRSRGCWVPGMRRSREIREPAPPGWAPAPAPARARARLDRAGRGHGLAGGGRAVEHVASVERHGAVLVQRAEGAAAAMCQPDPFVHAQAPPGAELSGIARRGNRRGLRARTSGA